MDINLARETINDKMAPVREHLNALKFATKAIPKSNAELSPEDIVKLHSLLTVVTASLDSAVDIACEDMAEYFKTWGD